MIKLNVNFKILLSLLTITLSDSFADKPKPNVIAFMSDDLGPNDVGLHGSRHLSTPNIDSLAADGIVLGTDTTLSHCVVPVAGLILTGIHPIHSGTQNYVLLNGSPCGLPLIHRLLPQYLKDLDYKTYAVGKWHLNFYWCQYLANSLGFDSDTSFWSAAEDYYTHCSSERGFAGLDFRDNLEVVYNASDKYSTDYFTDISLIEWHNRRIFTAILYSMDLSIGKINNWIERDF